MNFVIVLLVRNPKSFPQKFRGLEEHWQNSQNSDYTQH